MKTAIVENEIDRKGVGEETSFKIKANAKAFKILSDSLYSDKITAIVRETSCNACDSHVKAGHSKEPFFVQLPSRLEPDFVVRDHGVSMTHKQIMHLYTTYFESDKMDSNDFIGCLGLGSKSPFSYTDSFTVTAYLNGTKRIYTAFMAEDGCPSIALMGTFNTDEPNGLEIRFGVKSQDHHQFKSKAQKVYRDFKTKPEIKSDTEVIIPEITYIIKNETWGVRTRDYNMTGAYVIMGNVRYSISDMNADLSEEQSALLNNDIDIHCKIGDVEVAASREKISFDGETIKNIKRRLDEIVEEIAKTISGEFKTCKNIWEVKCRAAYLLNDKYANIAKLLKSHNMVVFNGEKVSLSPISLEKVNPDLHRENLHVLEFFARETRRTRSITHNTTNTIVPSEKSIVFVADINRGSHIRAKSLIHNGTYNRVYLIEFKNDAQKKAFVSAVGMEGMTIDPISNIPSPTKIKDGDPNSTVYGMSAKAKVKTLTLVDNLSSTSDSRSNWEIEEIDMDAGGFYIPMTRYKVIGLNACDEEATGHVCGLVEIINEAIQAGVDIGAEDVIVGAKPVVLDKFKKADKWVNVLDYIKEQIIIEASKITKGMIDYRQTQGDITSDLQKMYQIIEDNTELQMTNLSDNLFWNLYDVWRKGIQYQNQINVVQRILIKFRLKLKDYVKQDVKIEKMTDWTSVVERYPLISHVEIRSWDRKHAKIATKAVVAYVNTVEMAERKTEATTAPFLKKNKAA